MVTGCFSWCPLNHFLRSAQEVHPKITITKKSVSILDSMVLDTFEKIAAEAGRLVKQNHKKTLTSREIQTSIRLVFPGELAKHAVTESGRAGTLLSISRARKAKRRAGRETRHPTSPRFCSDLAPMSAVVNRSTTSRRPRADFAPIPGLAFARTSRRLRPDLTPLAPTLAPISPRPPRS